MQVLIISIGRDIQPNVEKWAGRFFVCIMLFRIWGQWTS